MGKRSRQTIRPTKGFATDLARELIPVNKATFLKNCLADYNNEVNGTGQSHNIGLITPPLSNFTDFDITLGTYNICIGSKYDRRINTMFWFVYTYPNFGMILQYDGNTNDFTTILLSTLLNFDPHFLITSIDVVLVDAKDSLGNPTQNVLLYWTDGNMEGGNQPRKLNVTTALAGGYAALTHLAQPYQFFDAAKYPPYLRPTFGTALTNPDTAFVQNFIAQKQFNFRYRFYYDDGEITKWSPISTWYYTLNNAKNFVELLMSAGSSLVLKVELAFKEGFFGDWKSFDTLLRTDIVANVTYPYNNTTNIFTYKFFNNRSYVILDQVDTNLLFDVIPQKAEAQSFVQGNLIVYSDILEGYDNLPAVKQALPTVDITYANVHDGNGTTLTLTTRLFYTCSAGNISIKTRKIDGVTGVDTILDTHVVTNLTFPPLIYTTVVTPVNLNDKFYLEVSGGTGTIDANTLSTFSGVYTNTTFAAWAGTPANFSVRKTVNQASGGGAHIAFQQIISDPMLTWNLTTYEDKVPLLAVAFPQLMQGGQYSFGFWWLDEVNRSTFVQTSPNKNITIESMQLHSAYQLQSIIFNWQSITLPPEAKNVVVGRTKELTTNRELERGYLEFALKNVTYYKADNVAGTPGVDIIATVQFTIDYVVSFNTANLFQTTTDYSYTEGDRIVIIRRGDGTWYDTATYGILDFPLTSEDTSVTFRFPYDQRLTPLPPGDWTWCKIYTPSKLENTLTYYEVSDLIPTTTVGGITTVSVATTALKTFDTYPVTWDATYFPMIGIATEPIEHHSIYLAGVIPSNGEDTGRPNVINPAARQLWKPTLSRYSFVYLATSFINGLSSFNEERMKLYDRLNGKIVQTFSRGTDMLYLCEDAHFRVTLNKQQVTYADGSTSLITVNDLLSDPIDIAGVDAGCQNSESFVSFGDLLWWIDTKRSIVAQCDWRATKDIAREGLIKSYIEDKTKYISRYNSVEDATTTVSWLLASTSYIVTDTLRLMYDGTYAEDQPAAPITTNQEFVDFINTLSIGTFIYDAATTSMYITNPQHDYGTFYGLHVNGSVFVTITKNTNSDYWIIPCGIEPKTQQYAVTFFNSNSKANYSWDIGTDPDIDIVVDITVSIEVDSDTLSSTFSIRSVADIADALNSLLEDEDIIDTISAIENNTVLYIISSSLSVYGDIVVGTHTYTASTTSRYKFTNNEYDIAIARNETLMWSVYGQFWSSMFSFTPEYYSSVDAQLYGLSMVTFKGGVPYFHNLTTISTYMQFYGWQTNQVLSVVCNLGAVTEKRFLTISAKSINKTSSITAVKYSGYAVTTSDNQQSSIPIDAFQVRENQIFAVIYRDTSLGYTLQTGAQLRGVWMQVTLVRDDDEEVIDEYSEISDISFELVTSPKAILNT